MSTPNLVDWRLAHGSMCHVCPLRGSRPVGCDGPVDAEYIGIGDFPSEEDAELGVSRGEKYGRAFTDKVGYFMKLEHIAQNPAIAQLIPVEGRTWPKIVLSNILLTNLIMCHIPGTKRAVIKIKSPTGQMAIRCCANSFRALLRKLLAVQPNRTLVPMGSDALSTVYRVKLSIEAYRGRVPAPLTKADIDELFAPEPENNIYKRVLRGKKPTKEWQTILDWYIVPILRLQRIGLRRVAKQGPTPPEEWNTNRVIDTIGELPLYIVNHATAIDLILKRQRAALKKREKANHDG